MMLYHYATLRNSKNKFWCIAEQKNIMMLIVNTDFGSSQNRKTKK